MHICTACKPSHKHEFCCYLKGFLYYMEGFHFEFPCHVLVPSLALLRFPHVKKTHKNPRFVWILLQTGLWLVFGVMSWQHLRTYQDMCTLDSVHWWWLYGAAPLEDHSASIMTWYPTQSHYPDTEPTSPCPILIIPSTRRGSNMYTFWKSVIWLDWESNSRTPELPHRFLPNLPLRPARSGLWTLLDFQPADHAAIVHMRHAHCIRWPEVRWPRHNSQMIMTPPRGQRDLGLDPPRIRGVQQGLSRYE